MPPKGLPYLQHHLFFARVPQHPPDGPGKGGSRALSALSARLPQHVAVRARSPRGSASCPSPRGGPVSPLTAAALRPLRLPSRRPSPAARGSAPSRRHGSLAVATRSDVWRGRSRAPYASPIGRRPLAACPPSARDWRVGSRTGRGGRGGQPGPAALGGGRDADAGRGQRTYCLRAGSRR